MPSQVCGRNWLSSHAGHQEVTICCTRGESQGTCRIYVTSAKCKSGYPLWIGIPEETSPEVQNRGISCPTKMTHVLQK